MENWTKIFKIVILATEMFGVQEISVYIIYLQKYWCCEMLVSIERIKGLDSNPQPDFAASNKQEQGLKKSGCSQQSNLQLTNWQPTRLPWMARYFDIRRSLEPSEIEQWNATFRSSWLQHLRTQPRAHPNDCTWDCTLKSTLNKWSDKQSSLTPNHTNANRLESVMKPTSCQLFSEAHHDRHCRKLWALRPPSPSICGKVPPSSSSWQHPSGTSCAATAQGGRSGPGLANEDQRLSLCSRAINHKADHALYHDF